MTNQNENEHENEIEKEMSDTERKDRATVRSSIVENGFLDLLEPENFEAAFSLYNSFDSAKKRTSKTKKAIKARPSYANVYFLMERYFTPFLKTAIENGKFQEIKVANRVFYLTGDARYVVEMHRIDPNGNYEWNNIQFHHKWFHDLEKSSPIFVMIERNGGHFTKFYESVTQMSKALLLSEKLIHEMVAEAKATPKGENLPTHELRDKSNNELVLKIEIIPLQPRFDKRTDRTNEYKLSDATTVEPDAKKKNDDDNERL